MVAPQRGAWVIEARKLPKSEKSLRELSRWTQRRYSYGNLIQSRYFVGTNWNIGPKHMYTVYYVHRVHDTTCTHMKLERDRHVKMYFRVTLTLSLYFVFEVLTL